MRAKASERLSCDSRAMTEASSQSIRDDLQTALEINPPRPEKNSLLIAGAFTKR